MLGKLVSSVKKIQKVQIVQALALALIVTACIVEPSLAEGTANTAVTGAFTSLKDDVIATLGAIAALAVTVMGIFLAWKYGRKIFNQVAK